MHDAKTNLSKLVERVARGEEVVIARRGKPVAKLVPISGERFPLTGLGALKGQIEIAPGSGQPDPELERLFYEGHEDDPLRRGPEEWEWPTGD